jgi:hypothetical protein
MSLFGVSHKTALFDHLVGQVLAECAAGADLVEAHEPRVAGPVSGHYCGQPASDTNWLLLLNGQGAPSDITPEMLPEASLGLGRCIVNKWSWLSDYKGHQ